MAELYKSNELYRTISLFCKLRNMSINAMCKKAEISPGLITDLKMGRKQTIQIDTAVKIAKAFDTDVSTLQSNRFFESSWDVDTCLKWHDADTTADCIYLLETYGIDVSYFKNKPDDFALVANCVFSGETKNAPSEESAEKESTSPVEDEMLAKFKALYMQLSPELRPVANTYLQKLLMIQELEVDVDALTLGKD